MCGVIILPLIECKKEEKIIPNENRDEFYVNSSHYDMIRFPLLKPFEIISINDGKEWILEHNIKPKNIGEINNPNNIVKIAYVQNLFLIYSEGKTILRGKEVKKAWYILDVEDNCIKGFETEEELEKIVKSQIVWRNSSELFKEFDETYCLEWIPLCKK